MESIGGKSSGFFCTPNLDWVLEAEFQAFALSVAKSLSHLIYGM